MYLLRVLIGFVLLASGLVHLSEPHLFLFSASQYPLFPGSGFALTLLFLPSLQIVVGVCFVCSRYLAGAVPLAIFLFGIFFAGQATAMLTGAEISCGCFGYSPNTISLQTIAVPFVCLLLCLIQLAAMKPYEAHPGQLPGYTAGTEE